MKALYLATLLGTAIAFTSCKDSSEGAKLFCDTACIKDTIRFTGDHPEKPHVYISVDDCIPDTVTWSHKSMGTNLKIDFIEIAGSGVRVNQNYIACYFNDTSYAWLEFNDCLTGRGFLSKLNFDKKAGRSKYSSALTRFDPKYRIADGVICYADRAFLYAEDVITGKIEKLLMADHAMEIDFNNTHATFDSVNISRNRIFVTLIENGVKRNLEKTISL